MLELLFWAHVDQVDRDRVLVVGRARGDRVHNLVEVLAGRQRLPLASRDPSQVMARNDQARAQSAKLFHVFAVAAERSVAHLQLCQLLHDLFHLCGARPAPAIVAVAGGQLGHCFQECQCVLCPSVLNMN